MSSVRKTVVKRPAMKRPAVSNQAKKPSLDAKIDAFIEEAKLVLKEDAAPEDILNLPWKDFFDGNEMSALWNRLGARIGASNNDSANRGWS